jgi:uncharacterized protein YceK
MPFFVLLDVALAQKLECSQDAPPRNMNDERVKRRTMKAGLWIAALLCLTLGSGCSTIVSHSLSKGAPPVYAGTWMDSHFIKDASSEVSSDVPAAIVFTYGLIDFPFSLVADTLCLPYDLAVGE